MRATTKKILDRLHTLNRDPCKVDCAVLPEHEEVIHLRGGYCIGVWENELPLVVLREATGSEIGCWRIGLDNHNSVIDRITAAVCAVPPIMTRQH